jgi:hypothetical protein
MPLMRAATKKYSAQTKRKSRDLAVKIMQPQTGVKRLNAPQPAQTGTFVSTTICV